MIDVGGCLRGGGLPLISLLPPDRLLRLYSGPSSSCNTSFR